MLSNMRVHAESWHRCKMTIINVNSSYLNIKFFPKKPNNHALRWYHTLQVKFDLLV